ncbi:MAG TPA: ABC transporter permease subunit [Gaiellaceae bacterium]
MSAIAVERPREPRAERVRAALGRGAVFVLVAALLWGAWEGYRWLWMHEHWTKPFLVDDISMPHLHLIARQLFEPARVNGPLLITILWHSALFTAKEAAVGFAIGASVGFVLGVVLAHFRILQRGLLPYIVASQTIPIIAIAPMVVVGLGNYNIAAWLRVAVIAAYLTFFPVTVNTLRGLQSAEPRALELMHSYAASRWAILWKLRVPSSLPYLFSAFKVSATASVVGAIIGEAPSSIPNGLGGAIINFNQYYALEPKNLWATNLVAAALGIFFFVAVVVVEKLVVRRAPEHVA